MEEILINIVNNMEKRIIFADNKGIIRYINKSAEEYYLKKGIKKLVGRSLVEFHKTKTNKEILTVLDKLEIDNTIEKTIINDTTIYAVRDKEKNFMGIYEIY